MFKGIRLIKNTLTFSFVSHRMFTFVAFAVIILGSIGLIATRGLNFGIDFTGGMLVEVRFENPPAIADMRAKLNALDMGTASIQEFGSDRDFLIRFPQQGDNTNQAELEGKIKGVLNSFTTNHAALPGAAEDASDATPVGIDYRRFEFVGPQVGKELIRAGLIAIALSIAGILAYISFRFEWQFGVASIVALVHDTLATIALFAWTQMEFDLATVAAVLLVVGYSINDTVVIFDRIRENLRKYKRRPMQEVLDTSINETLSRTVLTSFTTLLALVSLWLFGGEVVRGFVTALIFGIFIGTHSSIFVASPLLLYLGLKAKDVAAPNVDAEEKMV